MIQLIQILGGLILLGLIAWCVFSIFCLLLPLLTYGALLATFVILLTFCFEP